MTDSPLYFFPWAFKQAFFVFDRVNALGYYDSTFFFPGKSIP